MNFITAIIRRCTHSQPTNRNWEPDLGRKLRAFDVEVAAPYDNRGVVAFLKAEKLTELTLAQIRVFLLLRDTPELEGLSAGEIADHLDMAPNSVRSCLSALKRHGHARHSAVQQRDERGHKRVAWVYDPDSLWADEDQLYWEFAELF